MNSGVHRQNLVSCVFLYIPFLGVAFPYPIRSHTDDLSILRHSLEPLQRRNTDPRLWYKNPIRISLQFTVLCIERYCDMLIPPLLKSCHEGFTFAALFWARRGQTIQSAQLEDAYRHDKNGIEWNWILRFALISVWIACHWRPLIFSLLSLVWEMEVRLWQLRVVRVPWDCEF
jgi:hypothetical protein